MPPGEWTIAELNGARVLVVGGGGFIGRHVVDAFRGRGASVSVMDKASPPAGATDDEWIVGAAEDVSLLASAGAAGIVVGLALQPLLKNLFAGIQLAIALGRLLFRILGHDAGGERGDA